MRGERPTDTVTFLFTDVEGSTRLLHELGAEAYADALADHRRLIRRACAAEGGVEVDTQGDAFFFAFPTAPGALAAAAAMTESLAPGRIQVRVGVHTGTALLTEEGYVGDDVHVAARIASTAHGGQVICSAATASLVHLSLTDLGEHRLRDVAEPVAIYQLGNATFPPLKTISNTNLPRPASSFVGRERELGEVLARIQAGARLVTLTGPGGTGKTRLALEAALTLVPEFKAGVYWVGLASLRDPALVIDTIAQTLGAKDSLAAHIGEREFCLLLDNLEQVIECAPELGSLLATCPDLTLIVTSRELLRVSGEVEYAVPPLAISEAVSLFCERAQLEGTEEIVELCVRLDSLPLAVELAAARTKALTPAQILERLSGRLDLLRGGRDADPRQQTLRATIEWSRDLLSPAEQQLFARLSVFAGGCTLDAAEVVSDADLDTLQSLVEKSLLRFSDRRYWMLDTIREYAGERLDASGEAGELRRRHAENYRDFVVRVDSELRGDHDGALLDELATEIDNIRVALAWAEASDPTLGLEIATSMGRYWWMRDPALEGRRWYRAFIAAGDGLPPALLTVGLADLAFMSGSAGDHGAALASAEEAVRLARALDDDEVASLALYSLGNAYLDSGQRIEAEAAFDEVLSLVKRTGNRFREAATLYTLAGSAKDQGDLPRARALMEDALIASRESGAQEGIASSLLGLASIARHERRFEESLALLCDALVELGQLGFPGRSADALVEMSAVLSLTDRLEMSATLLGAAEAVYEAEGIESGSVAHEVREVLAIGLGAAAFERCREAGRAMTLDEAVDYGLASRG